MQSSEDGDKCKSVYPIQSINHTCMHACTGLLWTHTFKVQSTGTNREVLAAGTQSN